MPDEMGVFEAIYTLRSMRRLKPDPVPDALLRRVLEAATRAGSGRNLQPWDFLVVQDAALRREIGRLYAEAWEQYVGRERPPESGPPSPILRSANYLGAHMGDAPVLILVCTRRVVGGGSSGAGVSTYSSIFPAVQNLMLAARARGLGTTLTTVFKYRDEQIRMLLGIPEDRETVALIPLGYPRGKFGMGERRPVHEVVHFDAWGRLRSSWPE